MFKFFSAIILIAASFLVGPTLSQLDQISPPVAAVVQKQPADKALLNDIRAASVSVEVDERSASGTLIGKEGEMYCVTAAHVIGDKYKSVRVTQYGKNIITIYAHVQKINYKQDWAVLKVGKGVFVSKVRFCKDKQELDTPVIHCGSMIRMHHTVTRGTLVGVDREWACWEVLDQLDITANRGSSGGGVFDESGNYLGMVVGGVEGRIVFMVPSRLIDF